MLQVITQNNINKNAWDIAELVKNLTWVTQLLDQPGKVEIELVKDDSVYLPEGSPITIKFKNDNVFFGYLFTKKIQSDLVTLICYDQTRYLKNKDTYVLGSMTSSQVFTKLATDFNLKSRVVNSSSFLCAAKVYDNKSLYEIIQDTLDQTLTYSGEWFIVYDRFGTLEFTHLNSLKTNLFIGDESLLTNYDYQTSIDDDVYNQVKLIQENKETKKRDVYLVKSSQNINRWGLLQYFEKMDENANAAQIKQRADQILQLKNRPKKTLSLDCIGDLRVRAGTGIVLGLNDLKNEGLTNPAYYIVTSCTHKFSGDQHTMELELQVSI